MRYIPFDRKQAPNFWLYVALFFVLAVLYGIASPPVTLSTPPREQVTLKAHSWNNGSVHVWSNLNEDATTMHVDVPDGAECKRLDNEWYKSRYAPAIYYYRVNCNGVIGYVERDQVR